MRSWRAVTTPNDGIVVDIFDLIVRWSSEGLLTNLNRRVMVTADFVWLFFNNAPFDIVRDLCDF